MKYTLYFIALYLLLNFCACSSEVDSSIGCETEVIELVESSQIEEACETSEMIIHTFLADSPTIETSDLVEELVNDEVVIYSEPVVSTIESSFASETLVYNDEPNFSVAHNGNLVNSYEVDGFGTVYGYYLPTSICESINNYRLQHGLSQLSIYDNSDAMSYSIIAACRWHNGQSAHGANEDHSCIHTGGDYENFVQSPTHFAYFNGERESDIFHWGSISSIRFVLCQWNGYEWYSTDNCATVVFYIE
ncbi:MAG: hypothetical protein MJ094_03275 [Saccharofermentans sp.]|nr:hypothetical protein [Saccharofermentans sp.]